MDVKEVILHPLVAYFNTDGSMNFAKDRFNYIVIAASQEHQNYVVVTWKEMSWYNNDVFDKQALAKKEIVRNDKKQNQKNYSSHKNSK